MAARDARIVVASRAWPLEAGGLRLRGREDVEEPVAVVAEASVVFRETRLHDGLKFFFGYPLGGEIGGDVDDALREARGVGGVERKLDQKITVIAQRIATEDLGGRVVGCAELFADFATNAVLENGGEGFETSSLMDVAAASDRPLGAEGGAGDVRIDGRVPAAGLSFEAHRGAGVAFDGPSGARRERAERARSEIERGLEVEIADESDLDATGSEFGIDPAPELGESAHVGVGRRREGETWIVAGNHARGGDLQGRGRLVLGVVEMRDDTTLSGFEFVEAPCGIAQIGAEKLKQIGQGRGGGAAGENEGVFVGVEGEGEVAFVDEALELVARVAADAGVVEVSAGEESEAGKMFGLSETTGTDAGAKGDAVASGIGAFEIQTNAVGEFDQVDVQIGNVRATAYRSRGCGRRVAELGGRRVRERQPFGGEAGAVGVGESGRGVGERKIAEAEEERSVRRPHLAKQIARRFGGERRERGFHALAELRPRRRDLIGDEHEGETVREFARTFGRGGGVFETSTNRASGGGDFFGAETEFVGAAPFAAERGGGGGPDGRGRVEREDEFGVMLAVLAGERAGGAEVARMFAAELLEPIVKHRDDDFATHRGGAGGDGLNAVGARENGDEFERERAGGGLGENE